MKKSFLLVVFAILGATPLRAAPGQESDSAPMYVDTKAINDRFSTITDEDMAMLRSKKVLLCGQSLSLILDGALVQLGKENKKYEYIGSDFHRLNYMDWVASKLPPNVFAPGNFIHFAYTFKGPNNRIDELDTLIRTGSYGFGKTVDAALILEHPPFPGEFKDECNKLDKLQADYPKIRFIYTTGLSVPNGVKFDWMQEDVNAFADEMRARYKGKAPLLDMQNIINDDFRFGYGTNPDYSGTAPNDPNPNNINLHPFAPAGQLVVAKSFLLILRDSFRAPWPPKPPDPVIAAEAMVTRNGKYDKTSEPISADNPDAKAVRALLDANGLKDKKVEDVAVVKGGRIVKLYMMGMGIENLTSSIGDLTELKWLLVYGYHLPWKFPLLKTVDPAIGKCTKLEVLALNRNDLTTLPDSISNLTNLKILSVGDNHLQNLSPAVTDLVKRLDPRGLANQGPLPSPQQVPSAKP